MCASYMVEMGGRVRYVTVDAADDAALATIGTIIAELAASGAVGAPKVTAIDASPAVETVAAPAEEECPATEAAPLVSTWTEQVSDDAAKERIEAQHAALATAGVTVDTSQQLYVTGTRLASEGYASQAHRKAEHEASPLLSQALATLDKVVRDEQREDVQASARDLAVHLEVNGRVSAYGLSLGEQAIRGLLSRLGSPALGYILGVRERIVRELGRPEAERNLDAIRDDKRTIHAVLVRECLRAPETALTLRTRRAPGDIFAIVSPSYAPADVTSGILDQVASALPADARGTWSYDAASTTWELRAEVWTPTPVDEQAVGEAFRGFVSYRSADNGTRRLGGGGGIELLRCLNASTYMADGVDVSRVHRGEILSDVAAMTAGALRAVAALTLAWGTARTDVLEAPSGLTLEDAIPGFWRHLLRDRRSELAGVLPGRTEGHVDGLTKAFHAERRDASQLVRADLAQGWTRYIQGQPIPVRRDAEEAIGAWMVRGGRVGCEVRS